VGRLWENKGKYGQTEEKTSKERQVAILNQIQQTFTNDIEKNMDDFSMKAKMDKKFLSPARSLCSLDTGHAGKNYCIGAN